MGKAFDQITPELQAFIAQQHVFFVATAPLSPEGHINLSPKGLDCFRILSPQRVAYLDLVGSGNETSAHILENGRITFMFCAFDGAPMILKLYGTAKSILPGDAGWEALYSHFEPHPAVRQIIAADLHLVKSSCGNGVPLMDYTGEREQLTRWAETIGTQALQNYQQKNSLVSMDGLVTELGKRKQTQS